MDIDGEGPQATYNRLMDEREERGRMVEERRGREVGELQVAMGVIWVMYMRYARRAEVSISSLIQGAGIMKADIRRVSKQLEPSLVKLGNRLMSHGTSSKRQVCIHPTNLATHSWY